MTEVKKGQYGSFDEHTRSKTVASLSLIPDEELYNNQDTIILNVGGVRHVTGIKTLLGQPGTKLGDFAAELQKCDQCCDEKIDSFPKRREYFFDRHSEIFSYILNFYRTGRLHFPHNLCGPVIRDELDFWQLDDQLIEPCCWVEYHAYSETKEALAKFEKIEEEENLDRFDANRNEGKSCLRRVRPKIWRFLEYPQSSVGAQVFAITSLIIVCISVIGLCLESYEPLRVFKTKNGTEAIYKAGMDDLVAMKDTGPFGILLFIDHACNVFFFLEFCAKFASCPNKLRFLRSPLPILEMVCIIPYYVAFLLVVFYPDPSRLSGWIHFLYFWRVLRIFRCFSLMKHVYALKILIFTIRSSLKELFLLILILGMGVIIFACIAYEIESASLEEEENQITSIFVGFWWAVVTMTTVGYGETVPRSPLGQILGAVCATSGVLLIALTVPIIVNNFTLYYTQAQSNIKLKERRKLTYKRKEMTLAAMKAPVVAKNRWNSMVRKNRSSSVTPLTSDLDQPREKNSQKSDSMDAESALDTTMGTTSTVLYSLDGAD